MQTAIKWDKFKALPEAKRMEALAGAIRYEFQKPALALALAPQAVTHGKMHGVRGERPAAPTFERIKSFLASKYGTPSDTPALTDVSNEFEQFFHTNMPEMDMAFAALFQLVPMQGSTHDHFDILDTNMGITFQQRAVGEEIKIRRSISESKTTVGMLEFADGLGILDHWLQFQMYWNVDEAIAEFRAKYYEKMAATHYALLTAQSTGIDQAFATDDTTTLNNAAATIIRACKSKGYAVGDNPTFYAVCATEKVGRLERMLTAQRGSAIVDQGVVSQPVSHHIAGIISTTHVSSSDTGYYLVLPGRKIKRGVWKDLTLENARNIYVSATDLVGRGQYNAAIGDAAQVRRVKYA